MGHRHLTLTPREHCFSVQEEGTAGGACFVFGQTYLKLGRGQDQIQVQPSTRSSEAGPCVKRALCALKENSKAAARNPGGDSGVTGTAPRIFCVYFGFRLTFHLSVGGGNG